MALASAVFYIGPGYWRRPTVSGMCTASLGEDDTAIQ